MYISVSQSGRNGPRPLGAILICKGAKKSKGAIGGEKTPWGRKCSTTNRSFIELTSVSYYYDLLLPCKF